MFSICKRYISIPNTFWRVKCFNIHYFFANLLSYLLPNTLELAFERSWILKEFTKLRQGSGGTCFITVQQNFKKVWKTKLLLQIYIKIDGLSCHSSSKCGFLSNECICEVTYNLQEMQKRLTKSDLMSSIQIAGCVERIDDNCDSYLYTKGHGSSLLEIYRRGLEVPGDTISQFFIYVTFYQASEIICCIYFTNILMIASDIYRLDINRNRGLILNNYYKFMIAKYIPKKQKSTYAKSF